MRNLSVTTLILVALFASFSLQADFLCSSEISYKWRREKETEDHVMVMGIAAAIGADEASTREKLAIQILKDRAQADTKCRTEHENLTRCISGKFEAETRTLNALGFSARKALEEAITNDCSVAQGRCGDTIASEIKCVEQVVPGSEAEAGKKEESKKEEKGKKK
jgi:hypothetical protein